MTFRPIWTYFCDEFCRSHSTETALKLFVTNIGDAIKVLDGTYTFIQKSAVYSFQRRVVIAAVQRGKQLSYCSQNEWSYCSGHVRLYKGTQWGYCFQIERSAMICISTFMEVNIGDLRKYSYTAEIEMHRHCKKGSCISACAYTRKWWPIKPNTTLLYR